MRQAWQGALITGAAAFAVSAQAQDRSADNAVTQAEDAFGFSVGRDTLGIYSAGSARGFSPSNAGNLRIDGLYFDAATGLISLVNASTSIKVGLSAQGYPFSAPSGVVDFALRRPDSTPGASLVTNGDSFGSVGTELTGSLPVTRSLAAGFGVTAGTTNYPDGTDNTYAGASLSLRWRPSTSVEVLPFWSSYRNYDDNAGPIYVPAGKVLPPLPPAHQYDGPRWASYNNRGQNGGVLASWAPGPRWLVRVGAFRSVFDQYSSFTNLLLDVTPQRTANRVLIADPPAQNSSISGELRVTHSLPEGPRLHVFHLSLRGRDARRAYGGSDEIDLGETIIGQPVTIARPDYHFGDLSRERVRQDTAGLAYVGRWKGVGELGLGLSRADYRKTTALPGALPIVAKAQPWLYNASLAATLTPALSLYAGYARGLEESGVAPPTAINRQEPLPAILTSQRDAGLRYAITPRVKLIAGVFDLRRPYFGFDAARRFGQVGTIRNRGAEVSISGPITSTIDLVAGGVFLQPRVEKDANATGTIGPRPVGVVSHFVNFNLNWRTPIKGLSLDASGSLRGSIPSTADNQLMIGERKVLNLGTRYRTVLAGRPMLFRLQVANLLNDRTWNYGGPNVFAASNGRYVNGFVAIDL